MSSSPNELLKKALRSAHKHAASPEERRTERARRLCFLTDYLFQNNPQLALRCAQQAKELDPAGALPELALGLCHYHADDDRSDRQVLRHLQAVLDTRPVQNIDSLGRASVLMAKIH